MDHERAPLLPEGRRKARDCSSQKTTAAVRDAKGGRRFPSSGSSSRPKVQILLLCYARLMEPLAFYSIFPYIAQMTQHVGQLPESDIGFYSGLFESLFSAVQATVLIFWGSMADRVGGKTVLVYSL